MRYSILATLCLFAAIIRPIFICNFIKDIIQERIPYQSGAFHAIDGLIFVVWLMEVIYEKMLVTFTFRVDECKHRHFH